MVFDPRCVKASAVCLTLSHDPLSRPSRYRSPRSTHENPWKPRRARRESSVLRRLSAPPLAIGRGLGRHVTRSHRLTPFRRNVAATLSLLFSLSLSLPDGKRRRRMNGRRKDEKGSTKRALEENCVRESVVRRGRKGGRTRKRNRRANLHSIKRRPRPLRQLTCCVSGTRARTWWPTIGRPPTSNESCFACTHGTPSSPFLSSFAATLPTL